MTLEIKSSLQDIETCHKNDLDAYELEDLRSLLSNIKSKTQPTAI